MYSLTLIAIIIGIIIFFINANIFFYIIPLILLVINLIIKRQSEKNIISSSKPCREVTIENITGNPLPFQNENVQSCSNTSNSSKSSIIKETTKVLENFHNRLKKVIFNEEIKTYNNNLSDNNNFLDGQIQTITYSDIINPIADKFNRFYTIPNSYIYRDIDQFIKFVYPNLGACKDDMRLCSN